MIIIEREEEKVFVDSFSSFVRKGRKLLNKIFMLFEGFLVKLG